MWSFENAKRWYGVLHTEGLSAKLGKSMNDDYIDRAHARSTTAENGYLPCARTVEPLR